MAFRTTVPKTKTMRKESIPQDKFFEYITIVSKAIQCIETEYNGKKFNGLVFSIPKNVKSNISKEDDFLRIHFTEDKKDISPIQETKAASKNLDNYLKKNNKVSITNRWCKMNKVNKIGKPPNFVCWPHNINSILFVIFNKGFLNIDWDEDMTYVNLSIDKDVDVKKEIFITNRSNPSKKESMNTGKTVDSVDDDDDDDQED